MQKIVIVCINHNLQVLDAVREVPRVSRTYIAKQKKINERGTELG